MINSFITQYETNFKFLSFRYVIYTKYPRFATNVNYNWVGFIRELQRNGWNSTQKMNLLYHFDNRVLIRDNYRKKKGAKSMVLNEKTAVDHKENINASCMFLYN